jgi:hypothetical protein
VNHWGGGKLVHQFPNPLPPCHFERFGSGPDEDLTERFRPPSDLRQQQGVRDMHMEVAAFSHNRADFRDDATAEAHRLCLKQGYSGSHSARAKAARAALKLSPHCTEAYNVLALSDAKTLEEALGHFRRAASTVCAAPDAWCACAGSTAGCTKGSACTFTAKGRLFEYQGPGRAHFRAMHGVAATLLKLGRGTESLTHYQQLQLVDNAWGTQAAMQFGEAYRSPSYLIYHPQMAQAMLMAGEAAQARQFLLESEQAQSLFDRVSSVMPALASLAFCDFKLNGPGCRINEFVRMKKQGKGATGPIPLEMAVCYLGTWHPKLLGYMSGEVELPDRRIPQTFLLPSLLSGATSDEYASYALYNGSLWRETPGALEWAIKHRNTYCSAVAISIAVSEASRKDQDVVRQRVPHSHRLHGTYKREVFWGETKEIGWDYARPGDDADDSTRSKTRRFLDSFEFFKQRVVGGVFSDRLVADSVPDEGGWDGCLLCMACKGGDALLKHIQVLLKAGLDPNARTVNGNTCMLTDSIVLTADQTEIFEWLLAFGGDFKALNMNGDQLSCIQRGFRVGKARYVETLLAVHLEQLMYDFSGPTTEAVEVPRCCRSLRLYSDAVSPRDQVRVFLCTTLRQFVFDILKPLVKFGLMRPETLRKDLKRCLEVLGKFGYSVNTHKQALEAGDETEINAAIRHILGHQVHQDNSSPVCNVANLRPRLPDTGLDFYPQTAVKFTASGGIAGLMEDSFSEEEAIKILQRVVKTRKAAANNFFKLGEFKLSAAIYVRLTSLIKKVLLPLYCDQGAVVSGEVDVIHLLQDFMPADTGTLPDLLKELSILYSNHSECCLSLEDYALARSSACASIEANPLFYKSWRRLSKAYLGLADSFSLLRAAESATIALQLAVGSADDQQLCSIATVAKELAAKLLAQEEGLISNTDAVLLVHCVASTDSPKCNPEFSKVLRAAIHSIRAGFTRQGEAQSATPRSAVFNWLNEHSFGLILISDSESDSETGCDPPPSPSFTTELPSFTTEQLSEWIGTLLGCLTDAEARAVQHEIVSSEFNGSDFMIFNIKILRRLFKGTAAEGAETRLLAQRDEYLEVNCTAQNSPEPAQQQSTFALMPQEALLLICASLTRVDRVNFSAAHPNVRCSLFSEAAAPLWAGILNLHLAGTRLVMDGGGFRRKDRCFQCGRRDVKRCARCNSVWFCGTKCHTRSWACGHDIACNNISQDGGCRMCGKSFRNCCCLPQHSTATCPERLMASFVWDFKRNRGTEAERSMYKDSETLETFTAGFDKDEWATRTGPAGISKLDEIRLKANREEQSEVVATAAPRRVNGLSDRWLCSLPAKFRQVVMAHTTHLVIKGSVSLVVGAGTLMATGVWPVVTSLSLSCADSYRDGDAAKFAVAQFISQLSGLSDNLPCLESIAFEKDEECSLHFSPGLCDVSIDSVDRPLNLNQLLEAFPRLGRLRYPTNNRGPSIEGREWVPHPEFYAHCNQAELSRIKVFHLHPTFEGGIFSEGQQKCHLWLRESLLHLPGLETLRLRFDCSCGDVFEFLVMVATLARSITSIYLEVECTDMESHPCVVQRVNVLRCLGLFPSRAQSLRHIYIRFDTNWQLRGYRGSRVRKLELLDHSLWEDEEGEEAAEHGCGWQPNKLAGNEYKEIMEPADVVRARFSLWQKFCEDIDQATSTTGVDVMIQPCHPVPEELYQTYCSIIASKQEESDDAQSSTSRRSRALAGLPRSWSTAASAFEIGWSRALHGPHVDSADECPALSNSLLSDLQQRSSAMHDAQQSRLRRVEKATG